MYSTLPICYNRKTSCAICYFCCWQIYSSDGDDGRATEYIQCMTYHSRFQSTSMIIVYINIVVIICLGSHSVSLSLIHYCSWCLRLFPSRKHLLCLVCFFFFCFGCIVSLLTTWTMYFEDIYVLLQDTRVWNAYICTDEVLPNTANLVNTDRVYRFRYCFSVNQFSIYTSKTKMENRNKRNQTK